MENSRGRATSIPQVNDPDGLVTMLDLILKNPRTNSELTKALDLRPRELSYRLAALRFFRLIRKTSHKPSTWEIQFISDESSGIRVTSAAQILKKAILDWNESSLGLNPDLSSSEYEIWKALSNDSSRPVGEVTMGRRVSSYKKLVRWAIEMER
jgi:hypothetical protein